MRILYLSQYFPPEAGATQTRAYEMARNWVKSGHHVTMITEFPNHPSGIIPSRYRGKLFERDTLEGIEVIRVWVKASPIKNFRNRMLFYLTFMVTALLGGLFHARAGYDLIYASSPPLFVGGAALALSYLKRTPLVFEVRDLWPESAVALGELNSARAVALATRLEEACYRKAWRIVVVTRGIRDRLVERGIPSEKLLLIPNGANTDLFQYDPAERESIRLRLGLTGKFVAIYAGIHGIAQGLETIVEAARLLQDRADVHFLMIGEGPKKVEAEALAVGYNLSNISFLPEQPRHQMPALLSVADVSLIPLRRIDLFKGALPSKMFDAWACLRPILLSVDGEARQVLEEAQGGLFVPPEDASRLASAILQMRDTPAVREQMGLNGRSFTMQYYSRESLAAQLIGQLAGIARE